MATDRTDLATRSFAVSINRALALYTAVAAIASFVLGAYQAPYLDSGWLMIVGVLLLLGSVGLVLVSPLEDWSRLMHRLFGAATFAALLTWPLAWQGAEATAPPFIWPLLSVTVLMIGWAGQGLWVVTVVSALATLAWGFLRITPSGGSATVLEASQEGVFVIALTMGTSAMLTIGFHAAEQLDASTDRAAAVVEQIAIRSSMQREQRTLDALVHDQVMTTLAAAGRETMSPDTLAEMATRAMASLTGHNAVDNDESATADEAVDMLVDMVTNVTTSAILDVRAEPGIAIPRRIAMTISMAAQEAVLNAVKHAKATTIRVTGRARTTANGEVDIRLDVTDDGVGFDVSAVPERRLGVRLALQERMRSIGGIAVVRSSRGAGTKIEFRWLGHAHVANTIDLPSDANPGTFFDQLDVPLLIWIGRVQVFVMAAFGIADGIVAPEPLTWVGLAVALFAVGIVLGPRADRPLRWPQSAMVCLALAGVVAVTVLHVGDWSPVNILLSVVTLFTLRVRGGPIGAWLALILMAASGWATTQWAHRSLFETAIAFTAPLLAVLLSDYLMRWFSNIGARVEEAHVEFERAAARAASLFSALLRRDVWMASLRGRVEPVLQRLADASAPLTEPERDQCVRLEARLRDTITARNLVNPTVSEAVERARERGVSVTLVDNRESTLPEPARSAARKLLAAAADRAKNGRIVARVAPEGYRDLVTIMTDSEDSATLVSIDEEGQVTEK